MYRTRMVPLLEEEDFQREHFWMLFANGMLHQTYFATHSKGVYEYFLQLLDSPYPYYTMGYYRRLVMHQLPEKAESLHA